jgi:hypothetical protein
MATTLAAAASANAAPNPTGVTTFQQNFAPSTVPGVVRGSLTCPAGTRLVGSGGSGATILAEAPIGDPPNGAVISAMVTAPGGSIQLTILCAPASQFSDVQTVVLRDQAGVTPGVFKRSTVRCPAGFYAFGGGGYFSQGTAYLASAGGNLTNAPFFNIAGQGWTYGAVAPSHADTLTIIVQCAPLTGHNSRGQSAIVSTGPGSVTGIDADCPSGFTRIGGGFDIPSNDPNSAVVVSSTPTTHGPARSSWFAGAIEPAGGAVNVLAVCVS